MIIIFMNTSNVYKWIKKLKRFIWPAVIILPVYIYIYINIGTRGVYLSLPNNIRTPEIVQ